MTDDQLKSIIGVDETRQMLDFREQVKSQMTSEEWEQNMTVHKTSIQTLLEIQPSLSPAAASEVILNMLDEDEALDADQREVWKAMVVIAAFEMQEF